MAKYKIGDSVIVKEGLVGCYCYGGLYFSDSMEKFCGMKAKIVDYSPNGNYFLDITEGWVFNDAMLIKNNASCKFMKKNKV